MEMTHTRIVQKLIGPIRPVGETHCDNDRFENLKQMTELVHELAACIRNVAAYHNSHLHSEARAGKHAEEALRILEEVIEL